MIVLGLIQPAYGGEGDLIPNANVNPEAKTWWVNCKSLTIKDDCIESVEMLDPTTGKWTPAIEEKSEYWKPGVDLPIREANPAKPKCGLGNASYADYCYWFKGAAVDGTDQMLTATVYSREEVPGFPRISLTLQGQNGLVPKKSKIPANNNAWVALKPETTLRLTVISDTGAQRAGIALAKMKNPSLAIEKGSDGKFRLIASGSVQEVNEYKWFDRDKPSPCNAVGGNDLVANYYNVEFAINIEPYYREYAVLQGTPPGGIFITQNGGCDSRVTVDPSSQMIQVVSTGTHYDVFGDVIIGWVEASIRGDMVRKVFKLEPKTMNQAIIEVTSADGTQQNATYNTRYLSATDVVEIRAFGYNFSSKTIKIKLPSPSATPSATPSPTPTSTTTTTSTNQTPSSSNQTTTKPAGAKPKQKTLICKKGKLVKKIVGSNPKCPAGYRP